MIESDFSLKEMVACRGLANCKRTVHIDRWKFEAIRGAILQFYYMHKTGAAFADLVTAISQMLRPDILEKLGPLPEYATIVMLEMETAGEIIRMGRSDPDPMVRAN